MLHRFLQSNPAVRLLLPLVLGIILGSHIVISSYLLLCCLIACTLVSILSLLVKKNSFSITTGFSFALFFILLGVFLVQRVNERYLLPEDLSCHYIEAVVRTEAVEKKQSTAAVLEVYSLQKQDRLLSVRFKALVYFSKDSSLFDWQYGDTIIGKLDFFSLRRNTNPYAFDYAKLLERRQIHCMARGKGEAILRIKNRSFSIRSYARSVQCHLRTLLDSYIPDNESGGFLQAMTLGDKTALSPEVQIDFADAGVVHILAVSGLHVGILFLLLNTFLRPLNTTKKGRRVLFLICLLAIWSFAFISGLSVSILRAAVMFSVLQLSLLALRSYRVYNAIAISAFILLLFNPFYVYEVGFQLSYLAVLSIVSITSFQKKRNAKEHMIDKLKNLLVVSLAAQFGVAPLVLCYFHQLPTYFLLGNIVVLTMAPCLLGGSLFILIFSKLTFVPYILGLLVCVLTQLCLWLISSIATLPGAVLINYSLELQQMLLLYALLISLLFYFIKRTHSLFIVLLCLLSFLVFSIEIRKYREDKQELFVVHQLSRRSCYSIISGRASLLLTDLEHEIAEEKLEHVVYPLWEARNIYTKRYAKLEKKEEIDLGFCYYKDAYLFVKGKLIMLCPEKVLELKEPFHIDVLVLSIRSDWHAALKSYKFKQIVLDASFSKKQSQKLIDELLALKIPLHNVNTEGAFVLF